MEKSTSIKNLAAALMVFHVKVETIKKDAKNPFFKSKYASLSNILEAINIPLNESGLAFSQFPTNGNGLTSILIHAESGEYMQDTFSIHPVPDYEKQKNSAGEIVWRSEPYISPQGIGSAITYARRYALSSILGLNIDDDDDGNAASFPVNDSKQSADKELPWLNESSKEFAGAVEKIRAGKSSVEALRKYFKISKATETKLAEATKLQPSNN